MLLVVVWVVLQVTMTMVIIMAMVLFTFMLVIQFHINVLTSIIFSFSEHSVIRHHSPSHITLEDTGHHELNKC